MWATLTAVYADPAWYKDSDKSGYSPKKYVIGYGKATSYEEAISAAQNEIASQFEIHVKSTYSASEKETQENFNFTNKTKKKSRLKTMTDHTISGIEIVKRQKQDDTYFILAVLDKKSFIETTRQDIEELTQSMVQTFALSRRYELALNPKKMLMTCHEAYEIAEKIEDLNDLLSVVGSRVEVKPEYSPVGVEAKIQAIVQDIALAVVSGQGQTVELGNVVKNPIEVAVTYKDQRIGDVPIYAEYASKERIPVQYNSSTKLYSLTPYGLPNPKGTFVKVGLDVRMMPAVLRQDFDDKDIQIAYTIPSQASIPLNLSIKETSEKSILEEHLKQQLRRLGFTFSEKSTYNVSADVTIVSVKKTGGYFRPYYIVKTRCSLVVLTQDKQRVGIVELSGQGTGNTQELAVGKSYLNYTINTAQFLELIAKAKYLGE